MSGTPGRRIHFGSDKLESKRDISVFINCPFDHEYQPIFDAIVFSTVSCGFLPRSAIESGTTSLSRIDRITRAMLSSRYSIHDLSRCRGEGDLNLARFNMPLELGMAMAQKFRDNRTDEEHDWLLLVPEGHLYTKFISDIAGYDPKGYDLSKESMVPAVMSWLATRPDAVRTPTPKAVLDILDIFEVRKRDLDEKWRGSTPWADIVLLAMDVAQEKSLVPQLRN